ERYAIGLDTQLVRMTQDVDSHLRLTAELARQRPFGAFAVSENTAEHTAAWSSACDLLDFFNAIDRKQANAHLEGACNIAFLLDGVAIADAICRRASVKRHLDFSNRSG